MQKKGSINMKKFIGFIIAVLIIGGLGFVTLRTNKLLTLGATKYYVKTTDQYKAESSGGYERYRYKLPGYDKDGNEKLLDFTSNKVLKADKYLKVYDKNDVIKSFEEIQKDDLPEKVKEIFKIK